MRFQSGPGHCGPASVVNALRVLGIKVREDHVALHAGTTTADGTTEHGLRQALERYSCEHRYVSEQKYSRAEEALWGHLRSGPAIILAEEGNHWVTAIGTLGGRVVIFDPQNHRWNRFENGIHVLKLGDQLRRYWLPFEGKRCAILVTGP